MNTLPSDHTGLESPVEGLPETAVEEILNVPEIPRTVTSPIPSPARESPAQPDSVLAYYRGLGATGKTIHEALFLAMTALWLSVLLSSLHLTALMASQENAKGLTDLEKMSPILLLGAAVLLAPCIEESLFRGLPFLVLRLVGGTLDPERLRAQWLYWPIGTAAALIFAIAHGAGDHTLHVPLPQLMLGLWSWHVINTRGLRYSILLHGTYNFLPTCLMLLSRR